MRDQRFRAEQSSPETSWKKSKSLALATLLFRLSPARSETREQWIELGAKAHSAFGAFIPAGIRIDLDARDGSRPARGGLRVTLGQVADPHYQYTSIWVSNAEIPFISQLAAILNNRCRSG